jgi:hypothetical protein
LTRTPSSVVSERLQSAVFQKQNLGKASPICKWITSWLTVRVQNLKMRHICLLLIALVTCIHCFGSLSVTYNSATCGGANNDPSSVRYTEVNANTCSGVGTQNCTTSQIFGRSSSTVQTCEANDAVTKNYLPATSLYYGSSQYKDTTCGNTSTSSFSQLTTTSYSATTGGYVCYGGDGTSANPSIRVIKFRHLTK